jgi:hypothetical protein
MAGKLETPHVVSYNYFFVGDDVRSLKLNFTAVGKVRDSSPRLLREFEAASKSPLASPAMNMKVFGFTTDLLVFVGDDVRSLKLIFKVFNKVRDSSPRLLQEFEAASKSPLALPAMNMKVLGFTV